MNDFNKITNGVYESTDKRFRITKRDNGWMVYKTTGKDDMNMLTLLPLDGLFGIKTKKLSIELLEESRFF